MDDLFKICQVNYDNGINSRMEKLREKTKEVFTSTLSISQFGKDVSEIFENKNEAEAISAFLEYLSENLEKIIKSDQFYNGYYLNEIFCIYISDTKNTNLTDCFIYVFSELIKNKYREIYHPEDFLSALSFYCVREDKVNLFHYLFDVYEDLDFYDIIVSNGIYKDLLRIARSEEMIEALKNLSASEGYEPSF